MNIPHKHVILITSKEIALFLLMLIGIILLAIVVGTLVKRDIKFQCTAVQIYPDHIDCMQENNKPFQISPTVRKTT